MTLPKGEGSVDPQGEHFGACVRRLREERDIGLRPFAKMIKVSATYLSKPGFPRWLGSRLTSCPAFGKKVRSLRGEK